MSLKVRTLVAALLRAGHMADMTACKWSYENNVQAADDLIRACGDDPNAEVFSSGLDAVRGDHLDTADKTAYFNELYNLVRPDKQTVTGPPCSKTAVDCQECNGEHCEQKEAE